METKTNGIKKPAIVETDDSYGSGWIRPTRLKKSFSLNISKDETENSGLSSLMRQHSSSTLSAGNFGKRNRLTSEGDSDFHFQFLSPRKKAKTSPVRPYQSQFLGDSPEPKSLLSRMTTREGDGMSPGKTTDESVLNAYLPSFGHDITPTRLLFGQRQSLLPAPVPTISPSSFLLKSSPAKTRTMLGGRRLILSPKIDTGKEEVLWNKNLCLDWSLKTSLRIESAVPFGWASTHLKASEESSGTSAFARCVDIGTSSVENSQDSGSVVSQLDTSLGAQFHAACLYWQHPYIPSVTLFPRIGKPEHASSQSLSTARLDEDLVNSVQSEWGDAFRSCFQLLRSRQCPFFYICAPQFTALFLAAGTQGDERTQILVNPSTRGLREAMKSEGVNFSMPYGPSTSETDLLTETEVGKEDGSKAEKPVVANEKEESDDETDKWMDDMGISQDVTLFRTISGSNLEGTDDAKKSLLLIVGSSDSLSFFNFLLNSKPFLITSTGNRQAGIPPTILSPVAFHGASLRSLKVKQSGRGNGEDGKKLKSYNIELQGPILPNVIHQLCSLLSSTVVNYTIGISTLKHTIPLNVYSNVKVPTEKLRPSAFELQNLSDCGLRPNILEVFCKCDNCDTMTTKLQCKESQFQWT